MLNRILFFEFICVDSLCNPSQHFGMFCAGSLYFYFVVAIFETAGVRTSCLIGLETAVMIFQKQRRLWRLDDLKIKEIFVIGKCCSQFFPLVWNYDAEPIKRFTDLCNLRI